MGHNIHTLKEAGALALRTWRNAAPFFLSIELALMVLAAVATVAGVWLAVMQDARSLLAFGFAIVYVATRIVLHAKGKLGWPFI
jgi:cytochrome c biogenesis factor